MHHLNISCDKTQCQSSGECIFKTFDIYMHIMNLMSWILSISNEGFKYHSRGEYVSKYKIITIKVLNNEYIQWMIQIPLSWWMSLNSKVDWYHPILCSMIYIKWMSEQGGTFMQMIGGVASEKCSSSQLVDLMMNEVWFGVHRLKSSVSKPNPRQEATFLAGPGWKYPLYI